jgi:hypothetical protein
MDGRTDGFTWGAPKPVRPSLWPYPLGGAPNGYKAEAKLDPDRPWGKGRRRSKIVMECRRSPVFKRGGETKKPAMLLSHSRWERWLPHRAILMRDRFYIIASAGWMPGAFMTSR